MRQSWTPEMVEPRGDMEQMASLQENKHVKSCKSLKLNEAPAGRPANKQQSFCSFLHNGVMHLNWEHWDDMG